MYTTNYYSQDGPMINIEENGNFQAMQSSCLYTQVGFLYLLKPESE